MGKIRRTRTKRHIEAVKSDPQDNKNGPNFAPNQSELPVLFPVNNLFKIADEEVKDAVEDIGRGLQKQDEQSELRTKKDRRKRRHETFLKKLHASKLAKDDLEKTEKRKKTVITGDMNPLALALLNIDKLSSGQAEKKKTKNTKKKQTRKSSGSSEKKRQNAQLSDLEKFQQVLAHPAFKTNPLATIDEHVKNVIKKETNKS